MVMDGGKDQRKVDAHNIYIEVEVVKALISFEWTLKRANCLCSKYINTSWNTIVNQINSILTRRDRFCIQDNKIGK